MSHATAPRNDPAEELRAVALRLFAETSYAGASLQQIADAAGYSKSSVLYHFASKEALLEAVLAPAVDRLERLLNGTLGRVVDDAQRAEFVEEFIDFLVDYRFEAHIIINQRQSLAGIPTIDRASDDIARLAVSFGTQLPSVSQRVRLGVGLAGAAYILATSAVGIGVSDSVEEVRAALIEVVSELVVPSVSAASASLATAPPDSASPLTAPPDSAPRLTAPPVPAPRNRLTA